MGTGSGFSVQRVHRARITAIRSLVRVDTPLVLPGTRSRCAVAKGGATTDRRAYRRLGDLNPAVPNPLSSFATTARHPASRSGYIQLVIRLIASDSTS